MNYTRSVPLEHFCETISITFEISNNPLNQLSSIHLCLYNCSKLSSQHGGHKLIICFPGALCISTHCASQCRRCILIVKSKWSKCITACEQRVRRYLPQASSARLVASTFLMVKSFMIISDQLIGYIINVNDHPFNINILLNCEYIGKSSK